MLYCVDEDRGLHKQILMELDQVNSVAIWQRKKQCRKMVSK